MDNTKNTTLAMIPYDGDKMSAASDIVGVKLIPLMGTTPNSVPLAAVSDTAVLAMLATHPSLSAAFETAPIAPSPTPDTATPDFTPSPDIPTPKM